MVLSPVLMCDKSALESLNLDEAVLFDNFNRSNRKTTTFGFNFRFQ